MDGATIALSDLPPAAGMAGAAGTALGDQQRGAAGAAARGCGAPPAGGATPIGLGCPCGAGRTRPPAASPELEQVVRQARDAAALASRSGATALDLPTPAWSSRRGAGDPRSGVAVGKGEPDLGLPPHPR